MNTARTVRSTANQSHLHMLPEVEQSFVTISLLQSTKDHPLKSLQVRNTYSPGAIEPSYYSRLQILKSPAGYYLGTIYIDPEHLFEEPGSRDTTYFPKLEQAIRALELLTTLAISGNSEYPFDVTNWERTLTYEFKLNVRYRHEP